MSHHRASSSFGHDGQLEPSWTMAGPQLNVRTLDDRQPPIVPAATPPMSPNSAQSTPNSIGRFISKIRARKQSETGALSPSSIDPFPTYPNGNQSTSALSPHRQPSPYARSFESPSLPSPDVGSSSPLIPPGASNSFAALFPEAPTSFVPPRQQSLRRNPSSNAKRTEKPVVPGLGSPALIDESWGAKAAMEEAVSVSYRYCANRCLNQCAH